MSDHRLLPRYRHDFDERERERGRELRQNGRKAPPPPMLAVVAGADEEERERLRGIPVVGIMAGTVRGTDPFWETAHRLDRLLSVG